MYIPTTSMNHPETAHDSPQARGARLKKVRKMLGLTTEELSQLIGCTRQTISYWENATEGGLSQKGGAKLAEIARQRGIKCDLPWLLYGIGDIKIPELRTPYNEVTPPIDPWVSESHEKFQSDLKFLKEIESFLHDYPEAIIAEITDTSMQPMYEKGDWVGGHLVTVNEKLVGKICIVEIEGRREIRVIQLGDAPNKFNVAFMNRVEGGGKPPFELKNIGITRAAPIVRFWRK